MNQQLLQWPLLLVAVISFFRILFKLILKKNPLLPPSPPRLPLIGNLHQLGSLPHRSLQALSNKYGSVMLLHFGSVPTIVVSSADVALEMMKTRDVDFAGRPASSMTKRLLYNSDVAFVPYGEYWRQVRRITVVHLLNVKIVKSFQLVREEEVLLLIDKVRASPAAAGGVVNLSKMIVNLANDVVCRIALGRKYFEEGGCDFGKIMKEFVSLLGSVPLGDFIPWLGWVDCLNGLDGRVSKVSRELDEFLEKVLDEHIDDATGCVDVVSSNFVDLLLSLQEKGDTTVAFR